MQLTELGWNHYFQQQITEEQDHFIPARVFRQDVNQYHLYCEQGQLVGTLPGRFRQDSFSKADLPAVGDWVLVSEPEGAESGTVLVESLLERKSKFSRREAGDINDEQVVAANVDTVFVVAGLDDDFNVNRIERYLVLIWDSGALPVIILNKADLHEDLTPYLDELQPIAKGTPIHPVSAVSGEGMDDLLTYMKVGDTCALTGSSGVGKSTILNHLLGEEKFATGSVREDDSKGRHTTTYRELVVIPNVGLVIDTPGMRELQLWMDQAGLGQSFEDIEELALQCKFSDCGHASEPGCAIQKAIADDNLDADRLQRYYKLQREIAHFESQGDAAARAKKRQERRDFAKSIRNRPTKRD